MIINPVSTPVQPEQDPRTYETSFKQEEFVVVYNRQDSSTSFRMEQDHKTIFTHDDLVEFLVDVDNESNPKSFMNIRVYKFVPEEFIADSKERYIKKKEAEAKSEEDKKQEVINSLTLEQRKILGFI